MIESRDDSLATSPGRDVRTVEELRADPGYLIRVGKVLLSDPLEFFDRLRGRIERWRQRSDEQPLLRAAPDWEESLHEELRMAWPCEESSRFTRLWEDIEAVLGETVGRGHDADPALARATWCITLHTKADIAVETGVARGVTTRVLLEALPEGGRLWSIDLPPLASPWADQVGVAVPPDLGARWSYVRGSSRRELPRVLAQARTVDIFLHDSLHTRPTVIFELRAAWSRLRPGGFIVADDVELNAAFSCFAAASGSPWWTVAKHERKDGMFGMIRKSRDGVSRAKRLPTGTE